jgi:hypothetical protein
LKEKSSRRPFRHRYLQFGYGISTPVDIQPYQHYTGMPLAERDEYVDTFAKDCVQWLGAAGVVTWPYDVDLVYFSVPEGCGMWSRLSRAC